MIIYIIILFNNCQLLINKLNKIIQPNNLFKKLFVYLFNTTFGSFDYMRAEILISVKCERFWVSSFDNIKLDCIIVNPVLRDDKSKLVIFCNANAGFYEYCLRHNQWFDFYYKHEIPILIWNYRNYGKFFSWIKPDDVLKDSEYIFKYATEILGYKEICLHGESLGGAIATHVASKFPVKILICDRTFSDIYSFGLHEFGEFGSQCLYLLTGWKLNVSEKFINAKCYKVYANSPKDSIIDEICSLKGGISKYVSSIHFNEAINEKYPKSRISSGSHFIEINNILNTTESESLIANLILLRSIKSKLINKLNLKTTNGSNGQRLLKENDKLMLDFEESKETVTLTSYESVRSNSDVLITPNPISDNLNSLLKSYLDIIFNEIESIESQGSNLLYSISYSCFISRLRSLNFLLSNLDYFGLSPSFFYTSKNGNSESESISERKLASIKKIQEVIGNIKTISQEISEIKSKLSYEVFFIRQFFY